MSLIIVEHPVTPFGFMTRSSEPPGRPQEYNEPLDQRRPVYFTKTQLDQLERACGPKMGLATFIRLAALEKAGIIPKEDSSSIAERLEDIEALLRHSAAKSDEVSFNLPEDDRHLLEQLSESFGFAELGHFARSMTERALDHSREEVQEWLMGEVMREVEAELEAELKAKKKRKAA